MSFADHQIQNAQIFTAIVRHSRSLAQQRKDNAQQRTFSIEQMGLMSGVYPEKSRYHSDHTELQVDL